MKATDKKVVIQTGPTPDQAKPVSGSPPVAQALRIIPLDAALDAAGQAWETRRCEEKRKDAYQTALTGIKVQDALCQAKMALAKETVVSEGRRGRMRGRVQQKAELGAELNQLLLDSRYVESNQFEDREADRRYADRFRSSPVEDHGKDDR